MKNTILFIAFCLAVVLNSHAQKRTISKDVNPIEINAFLNKKGKSMLSSAKNKSYDEFRINFADLEIYMNYLTQLGMPIEQMEEDLERTESMLEDPIRKVFNELVAHIDSIPKEGKVSMGVSWSFQYKDGTAMLEPISFLFILGNKGVLVGKIETNNLSTLLIKKKAINVVSSSKEIETIKTNFLKNNKEAELLLDEWKSSEK